MARVSSRTRDPARQQARPQQALFQGTESVENDTLKPLYVRSTEDGTLKILCTDPKKIIAEWRAGFGAAKN